MDTCDCCDMPFTDDDPKKEHRVVRPSDPADMCCIMATHEKCLGGGKTREEWEVCIETEGARQGFIWLG